MNFLQIAGKDIRSILKNRIIRVSIIAIIIVPLLYSLLYLDAFWDPYSRLENMPIAVVNLDKGSEVDGEKVNYGQGIVDNLEENKIVGWKFVSKEEAKRGLEGNDYYAIFEISEDFSDNVVSAKEGIPTQAGLKFISNEKKNFLASQINTKVESELKAKVVSTITENYVKVAFDNLYTVKDGMVAAAEGSGQINDGLTTLNGKVPQLVNGVTQLKDGSDKLYNGQNVFGNGITELYNGVGKQLQPGVIAINSGLSALNGNVPVLSNGISDLYAGTIKLVDGTTAARSGSQELAYGTQNLYTGYTTKIYPSITQLSNGVKDIDTALTNNKDSINKLKTAASELTAASNQIKVGSSSIKIGYTNVEAGVNQLISGVDVTKQTMESVSTDLIEALSSTDDRSKDTKIMLALKKLQDYKTANDKTDSKIQSIKSGMSSLDTGFSQFDSFVNKYTDGVNNFAEGTTSLVNSVGSVQAGVTQINGGLSQLQTSLANEFGPGLNKVNTGVSSLNDGLGVINDGSIKINDGLTTIQAKTPDLTEGVTKLYNGSNQLLAGVNNVYDGTSKLASGSKELVDGQGRLKDGVNTLQSKIPDLKDGVSKLYDGTSELSTSLSDGAKKLDGGLVNSSEDMAKFISSPVEMEIAPINPVPNYGTGFAPYFMNLSLWIGAIMMFFVISAKTDEYENTSRFSKAFGKFLSFGFIGVIQAALVGIVLIVFLGLSPGNIPLYFGLLVFCSLVFVSIVQFLISLFGDAGRLLSIIYLILQLTACAGTFPLELVPGLFKILNPFMPFTYAVDALREVCSATVINYGIIGKDVLILGLFLVLFLGGSILFKHTGDKIQAIIEGKKAEAV